MHSLDRLLTLEQAAEKLHVKVRTLREWGYRWTIPFTKLGRRLYVDGGVIEKMLDANVIPVLESSKSSGPESTGQGGGGRGKDT